MTDEFGNSTTTLRWMLQASLGVMLVVLLAVHLIVNHWVAPQGLLSYADIIRYYDVPGIAWMEGLFLLTVTIHCALGIHSILLDLNLRPHIMRLLTSLLVLASIAAITYGVWLIGIVSSAAIPG